MGHIKSGKKVYHIFYGEGEVTKVSKKEKQVWVGFVTLPNYINDGVIPFHLDNVNKTVKNWDEMPAHEREGMTNKVFIEKFEVELKK